MAPRLIAAKDVTTEPKRGFRAGSMSGQCFFIIPETKRARLPNFFGGQIKRPNLFIPKQKIK
jgi:hypothetical protein